MTQAQLDQAIIITDRLTEVKYDQETMKFNDFPNMYNLADRIDRLSEVTRIVYQNRLIYLAIEMEDKLKDDEKILKDKFSKI